MGFKKYLKNLPKNSGFLYLVVGITTYLV
ncbi:hypothetical protein CGSSp14BS69_09826 [Streptococcus pneumoniae SP14-BS69]|nr:hypothetical protein CGSSp14BS69_09826 [Streptococcus pneumoniae SP14-BS69]